MKLVVTGGTGFIGSHLVSQVLAHSTDAVISLGRRTHELFSDHPQFSFVPLDLQKLDDLGQSLIQTKPDCIVHFGAVSTPQEAENNPALAEQMNVSFTKCLVEVAQECGAFLFFSSTDLVFGGAVAPADGFTEDHPLSPYSVYSRSKVRGEEMVRILGNNGCILRISLAYGPRIGSRSGQLGWMYSQMQAGSSVPLFYDEWRTPCYVVDIVRATQYLITKKKAGTFHCGGPERLSRLEFGKLFADAFSLEPSLIQPTSRLSNPGNLPRPEDTALNSLKLVRTTGIPLTPVREGLKLSHSLW